jgi:hypothetical protein
VNPHTRWALLTTLALQVCVPARGAAQTAYVEPDALDFGEVMLLSSPSMTVRIENTGTADLIVNGISSNNSKFTTSGLTFPTTIAPGAFESLTVTYRPTIRKAESATILIRTNARNVPYGYYYLGVSGVGVAPKIAVSNGYVGTTVEVGCTGAAEFTISNSGGNIPLVGNITMASGGSSEYSFSPTSFDLPLQTHVAIRVEYRPVDLGRDEALLMITSNDPTQQQPFIPVRPIFTGVQRVGDCD